MDKSFHYMLMASQSLVQKRLLGVLKDTGLTVGQPKILDYLYSHIGSSQKEIAAGCIIEAGSLTSVLNRMENDGMIERRTLNGNRRTYHIFLTEKGRILALRVRQAFSDMEKDIFKELSQDESNHFMKTFVHIYKHLLIKED